MPAAVEVICKRCGYGNVLSSYGEYQCFQCGAEHDAEGNLISQKASEPDLRRVVRAHHNVRGRRI